MADVFQRPFRTRGFAGASPATMWLANFRLSLRDEFKRLLELFVLLGQYDASILDNRWLHNPNPAF